MLEYMPIQNIRLVETPQTQLTKIKFEGRWNKKVEDDGS